MIRCSVVKLGDKLGNRRPGGIEEVGSSGPMWKEDDHRQMGFGGGAVGNMARRSNLAALAAFNLDR